MCKSLPTDDKLSLTGGGVVVVEFCKFVVIRPNSTIEHK